MDAFVLRVYTMGVMYNSGSHPGGFHEDGGSLEKNVCQQEGSPHHIIAFSSRG